MPGTSPSLPRQLILALSTMALLGMVRPTLFLKPGSLCVGLGHLVPRGALTVASDGLVVGLCQWLRPLSGVGELGGGSSS